ncbi:hypothetical protein F5984_15730 [Rudanella paleaurantiibacter]|uniref:Aerotolerance regulator N-terminal domain-containing protein n=1 Tax=Rudanella paleaurantiibacter TaxID=2614655 RepID=A0A7J5TWT5_9BACT|nr:hypothetical protein [Rudanella paleaurantiibacter]KAB7729098.1 hypothetical protein F5984_15730 [Rudanella paleaurantiibacter]
MTLTPPFLFIPLLLLGVIQSWFILRNQTLSGSRKAVRAGLNLLLWLVLLAFVWQPIWTRPLDTTHVLLVGNDVPTAVARQVQDSLGLRARVTATDIRLENIDSVTMLGQAFPAPLLARLGNRAVRWVPYEAPGTPTHLHWQSVVRLGEEQTVRGQITVPERQKLAVRFGTQTLDSLWLKPGRQAFTLRFPAVAKGRIETVLQVGSQTTDTVRFFAQAARPLHVQFVLGTPDFETKTLADWLGRQGNRVELSNVLSEGIDATVKINAPTGGRANSSPDLIVTEPALVSQPAVRKAIAEGKAVLVLNLTNPDAEVAAVNRSLGTQWRLRKVSNEATIPAGNGLTALPYQFTPNPRQVAVAGYPIATQRIGGRVAMSLFMETFPLRLSGDSLGYARIWNAVLATLQPIQANNFAAEGPVLAGLRKPLVLNNATGGATRLRVANDTAQLTPSVINNRTLRAQYRFSRSGWQPLADSVEVYVEDSLAAPHERVRAWVQTQNRYGTDLLRTAPSRTQKQDVPDWVWLTALLVCLTALWVEPKF